MIIDIIRSDGVLCCSFNSKEYGVKIDHIIREGSIELNVEGFNLASGIYLLKVSIWEREMIHPYIISALM